MHTTHFPPRGFAETERVRMWERKQAEALGEQIQARQPIGPDPAVLKLMRERGGSFASRLADAWMHADPTNSAKLAVAFGEMYDGYAKLVAHGSAA